MDESLKLLLNCSIAPAAFRVRDYALSETAIIDADGGRTGTTVKIDVEGEVAAADASAYYAGLQAFLVALRAADGRDFKVFSHDGNVEYELLAARVIDGGPWVENLSIAKQANESALCKAVSFSVRGVADRKSGSGEDPDDPDKDKPTSVRMTSGYRADGLIQISYSGKFTGPASSPKFFAYVKALRATYPPERWIESSQINSTFDDTQVEFTAAYAQLATPINLGGGNLGRWTAVDPERTETKDRDDKGRMLLTVAYDALLLPGDDVYEALRKLRETMKPDTILRETSSFTKYHELRLRCSFTVLKGGDGSDLLEWEQTVESNNPQAEDRSKVQVFEFPGRNPILVRSVIGASRYVQQGRAVGVNRFPKPPAPIFGTTNLAEQPMIRTRVIGLVECETTWQYVVIFAGGARTLQPGDFTKLRRPAAGAVQWLDPDPPAGGAA